METELFKTKFNKQETEYLNQYFDYVCPEIDKALTEDEKINLFKIFVIKSSSFGYPQMESGIREMIFAIEDLARGEDKTGKTTYRTKEHLAYKIAEALRKTKSSHYYFVDLMMKMAKIIGIEDSLIDEKKDFIHLRETNYPEFCKKYCPEFGVHNPVVPQVEGHSQEKVSKTVSETTVAFAEKSPENTKRKLFDFVKAKPEEIPEARKIALDNIKKPKPKPKTKSRTPEEILADIEKEKAEIKMLEEQDESNFDEFEKSIKGKEVNLPLCRNHIFYYENELRKLRGEKEISICVNCEKPYEEFSKDEIKGRFVYNYCRECLEKEEIEVQEIMKETPERILYLMRLGHPDNHGEKYCRGNMMIAIERLGKSLLDGLKWNSESSHQYKNRYTADISTLGELLSNKNFGKEYYNLFSVLEDWCPIELWTDKDLRDKYKGQGLDRWGAK